MAEQTVTMVSPDGKDVSDVPAAQVAHFKSLGAKVVEPPPPPTLGRRLVKGALDSLPGIGAVVGGVVSTPETMGTATIPGMALGAGVGRGVRDLIGHYSGLDEPTSALEKAAHIAGDTALTGLTTWAMPGAVAAAKAPLQTLREGAEQFGDAMPASVRRLMQLFPSLPKAAAPVLERPAWQTWGEPPMSASRAFNDLPLAEQMNQFPQTPAPELSRAAQPPIQNLGAEAPKHPLLDKSLGIRPSPPSVPRVTDNPNWKPTPRVSLASPPARPPMTVSPSSPMQPPAPSAPMPSIEGRPLPIYPSSGTVKGVTSNNLETASNLALAAGHWDEAERLIGQSLQSFFHGSGGPMAGVLAAAIAHKARQVVEPLRANPAFQQAPPAKQQQMIQQALRQPGARGALTGLLGSTPP